MRQTNTMNGNDREFWDSVDLMLLKLAKSNRTKISTPQDDQDFYEDFFNENDEKNFLDNSDPRRNHRGEIMRSVVEKEIADGSRILDVGCGTGDNLVYIDCDRLDCYGIEYAKSTAKMAEKAVGESAKISVASATDIPFPDDHFDFMMCMEVLEHIDDHETAMDEIARVLKPGGKFIMSVPYRYWYPLYFQLMGHYRHYTRSDVESMWASRGLVVKQHLENYPRWSRFANYCHVVCRLYSFIPRLIGKKIPANEVKLPFAKRTLHKMLFDFIEPVRVREIGVDYSKLPTSTFVFIEKES